jgi:hypothetical protein
MGLLFRRGTRIRLVPELIAAGVGVAVNTVPRDRHFPRLFLAADKWIRRMALERVQYASRTGAIKDVVIVHEQQRARTVRLGGSG